MFWNCARERITVGLTSRLRRCKALPKSDVWLWATSMPTYLPYTSIVHWQPKSCAIQTGLYLSQSFASEDPPTLASMQKGESGNYRCAPTLRNHSIFPYMHVRLTMPSLHHPPPYQNITRRRSCSTHRRTWTDLSDNLVRDREHHICRSSSCPERAFAGRVGKVTVLLMLQGSFHARPPIESDIFSARWDSYARRASQS